MNCLYILEINPSSAASFANIFSQFVGCLFCWHMISYGFFKFLWYQFLFLLFHFLFFLFGSSLFFVVSLSSSLFFLMSLGGQRFVDFVYPFKKTALGFLLIFSIFLISFISSLIFIISFLLLTLGFVSSSFSNSFR